MELSEETKKELLKKHKPNALTKALQEYEHHFGKSCPTINSVLPDFLLALVLKKCIEKDITYEKMFGLEGKII